MEKTPFWVKVQRLSNLFGIPCLIALTSWHLNTTLNNSTAITRIQTVMETRVPLNDKKWTMVENRLDRLEGYVFLNKRVVFTEDSCLLIE